MFMRAPNGVNCTPAAPPPERTRPCACATAAAELAAYQQAVLRDLSDTGLELVHALRDRVHEDEQIAPETIALAFARLSRAVRLTLALQTQVAEGAVAAPARAPRAARKAELDETLETILREESDKPFLERRTRLMRERLTELADREDFLDRPRGEIIARICQDLGLKIDWRDWWDGPEWALEAAEAEGVDPNNPPPRPVVVTGKSPGPDRARALLALLAQYAPPDSPFSAQAQAKARYAKPPPPAPDDLRVAPGPQDGPPPAPPPDIPARSPHALPREARRQALARKLAAHLPPASLNRMARFSAGP